MLFVDKTKENNLSGKLFLNSFPSAFVSDEIMVRVLELSKKHFKGIIILAEGVETQEEYEYLKNYPIKLMQGDSLDKYPIRVYFINKRYTPTGYANYCKSSLTKETHMEEICPHCSGKHKERDDTERKDLMNRLKRIEGQVRGVEGMLESDAYCTDILIQVSAISSALKSFNKVLLANHMKTCVAEGIRKGDDSVIDEFVVTLQKLMK